MSLLDKIKTYYRNINVEGFKERIQTIAKKIAEVPSIVSVFGLGYPFYGKYNIISRVEKTYSKEGLARQLLPDIDLLVVYTGGEYGSDVSDPEIAKKIMSDFRIAIWRDREKWNKMYRELIENMILQIGTRICLRSLKTEGYT